MEEQTILTKSKKQKAGKWMETTGYVLLFLGLCLFHFTVKEGGDTIRFREYISDSGLMDFLNWRYHTCTGRVFLEGMLYLVLKAPGWIFAGLNIAAVLGGVVLCKYLMEWDEWETGIFSLLLFFFPVNGLVEVGIQPGFINYVWALTAALAALAPLRMHQKGRIFRWYHYLLFALAALIGCNMEQTAAIVVCFYLIYLCYFGYQKKLHPILFSQLGISILSLAFLMTCEGNAMRMQLEIQDKWPGFAQLGTGEKIWNGWTTTMNFMFSIPNEPLFIFMSMLCVWLLMKRGARNICSILSILIFLWLCAIYGIKVLDLLLKNGLQEKFNGILILYDGGIMTAPPIPIFPQILCYSLLAAGILVCVAESFSSWEEAIFILLILGAGFASRMTMGFSPTLIASSVRTFLFLHVSLYLGAIHYLHQIRTQLVFYPINFGKIDSKRFSG